MRGVVVIEGILVPKASNPYGQRKIGGPGNTSRHLKRPGNSGAGLSDCFVLVRTHAF